MDQEPAQKSSAAEHSVAVSATRLRTGTGPPLASSPEAAEAGPGTPSRDRPCPWAVPPLLMGTTDPGPRSCGARAGIGSTDRTGSRRAASRGSVSRSAMPTGGLEPPQPQPLEPKPSASTNSARWAWHRRTGLPGAGRHFRSRSRGLDSPSAPGVPPAPGGDPVCGKGPQGLLAPHGTAVCRRPSLPGWGVTMAAHAPFPGLQGPGKLPAPTLRRMEPL